MSQQSILSRTLAALPLALLSGAALAQAQPGAAPGEGSAVHFIVFLVGLGLAAYWSVEAFARPAVLADLPTPPRYMTRSRQYKAGLCAFVGLSLLFYGILAYGHRDALPAVRLLNPSLYEMFAKEVEGNTPNYLLIVALLSGAFLGLLKLEAEWNPLFVLRRLILRWVAVPEFANELMQRGESALVVPPSGQAMVIGNPATPHVAAEDFRKDRQSLDRIWAELAYMYAWLDRQDEDGVDATFFAEPSFGWRQLQQDFANAAARIAPLKTGQGAEQAQFASVHQLVSAVRRRMCRLLACYLVYRNDTEADVIARARAFGIQICDDACENPLRYAVLYIVTIGVSVWLSVNFAAASAGRRRTRVSANCATQASAKATKKVVPIATQRSFSSGHTGGCPVPCIAAAGGSTSTVTTTAKTKALRRRAPALPSRSTSGRRGSIRRSR
jgi:hypothetical protein